MDRGYLFCQIMPLEVPVAENEIDLTIEITENSIVSIDQININGNTKTNENVIRRELRMFPGDIFSRDALMRSQNEIYMLNYFANVTPDVVPVSENAVDVELTVEEKSIDQAKLSFSISQVYGRVGGGERRARGDSHRVCGGAGAAPGVGVAGGEQLAIPPGRFTATLADGPPV